MQIRNNNNECNDNDTSSANITTNSNSTHKINTFNYDLTIDISTLTSQCLCCNNACSSSNNVNNSVIKQ